MTFRDGIGEQPTDYRNRNYVDDLELTHLAGQASADEHIRMTSESCIQWDKRCQELEREIARLKGQS